MSDAESESESSSFDDLEDLNFEYDFIENPKKKRITIRKSSNKWNIDKERMKKLQKVLDLPIPQRSINILSKFVINHQLTEIVRVIAVNRSCVTIQAKVNLNNSIYRDLNNDNVYIKVFTRRNHTRPDIGKAKEFNEMVCSKDIHCNPPSAAYNHLAITLIDNVIIMKMIGNEKLAPNLIEIIKKYPKKRLEICRDIFELVKLFRNRNYCFWQQKSSVTDILWHENDWKFLCSVSTHYDWNKKSEDAIFRNLFKIIRVFLHFGTPRKELRLLLNEVFTSEYRYSWLNEARFYINDKF